MDIEELELLLKEGEGLTTEFKESFSGKLDKDIVAFANTYGGKIFLGVNDQGKIIGETLTNSLKAKINSLARNCEPNVVLKNIEQLEQVVIITVSESDEKPHSCSSGYYRRLDATTQKMNQKELNVLFEKNNEKPSFEKQVNTDIDWEDLSNKKIQKFLSETGISVENIEFKSLLKSLDLADGNNINNAGVLFFTDNPKKFIPQCEMILVAFKGTEGIHIYDRIDVQNDLITQFSQAMLFIKKHLNVRSEIEGENRKDIYEIPLAAIREAIVNAIIHRDYAMRGTSILIEVHEDRIVIKNPGGLPAGVSVDFVTQISIRRNATIADMFARIEKAERIGSGIKRIMYLTSEAKLPSPIIESNLFFSITFKRDPKYAPTSVYQKAQYMLQEDTEPLTSRQIEILKVLSETKGLSTGDIALRLINVLTKRTIQRELQTLKSMQKVNSKGHGRSTIWFLLKD